jgi:hypothetical protein
MISHAQYVRLLVRSINDAESCGFSGFAAWLRAELDSQTIG